MTLHLLRRHVNQRWFEFSFSVMATPPPLLSLSGENEAACGWLTPSWFHSARWWLVVSLPNHFGRALTESDTEDALRRTGGEACCYWGPAFNLIALLRLLLVGYLPSECLSVHLETVHARLRRLDSHFYCLCLPLSSASRLFHPPASPLAPVRLIFFSTWTGPPLCLCSPLIFPRFFFSVSLPIFMPVPLCQYTFRHTLAPVFHPFFFSLSLYLGLSNFIKLSVSLFDETIQDPHFAPLILILSLRLPSWCVRKTKKGPYFHHL